jgi:hypothetical protein
MAKLLKGVVEPGAIGFEVKAYRPIGDDIYRRLCVLRDLAHGAAHGTAEAVKLTRVYVPTLRGLRPLAGSDRTYTSRTIKDYFPDQKWAERESSKKLPFDELNVFTGLNSGARFVYP